MSLNCVQEIYLRVGCMILLNHGTGFCLNILPVSMNQRVRPSNLLKKEVSISYLVFFAMTLTVSQGRRGDKSDGLHTSVTYTIASHNRLSGLAWPVHIIEMRNLLHITTL